MNINNDEPAVDSVDQRGTAALPEPKWLWRRIAVFGVMTVASALVAGIVYALAKSNDSHSLMLLALALIAQQVWALTVYLVAPSAEYVHAIGAAIHDAKS